MSLLGAVVDNLTKNFMINEPSSTMVGDQKVISVLVRTPEGLLSQIQHELNESRLPSIRFHLSPAYAQTMALQLLQAANCFRFHTFNAFFVGYKTGINRTMTRVIF